MDKDEHKSILNDLKDLGKSMDEFNRKMQATFDRMEQKLDRYIFDSKLDFISYELVKIKSAVDRIESRLNK